jgi:adhesin transport system outer membrane protein
VLPETAEQSQLLKRLEKWVAAWSAKDFPAYRAFYAEDFQPASGESSARWAAERQQRIARASAPSIRIEAVESEFTGAELARTHFIQHYQAGNYRDVVRKQLLWRRINGDWRIVGENLLPSAP